MKIALCLSGQYRTFDSLAVQNTLHHYILDKYDCDIYVSLWNNRGCSTNHGNPLIYKDENETITEKHITDFIKPSNIEIENYYDWHKNLSTEFKIIMGCSFLPNTIPLLYKKYKVHTLIPPDKKYDLIISTRPDMIYLNEFSMEEYAKYPNVVWNINPIGSFAYYPNRIFDILLMGKPDVMEKMSQCYFNAKHLLSDPYGSGLSITDPCKMLYIFANKFCNYFVQSTITVLANVYRNDDAIRYNCKELNMSEQEFRKKHGL